VTSRTPLNILFSGMIAADPHQGGATWAVLQYLLGLRRLGHEVWFVEPIAQERIQPAGAPLEASANARYLRDVAAAFGLEDRFVLLRQDTRQTFGAAAYDDLCRIAGECDVLMNVSGMLTDKAVISRIPTRVYIDLDPAFIQLWDAVQGVDMRFDGHTHFVTVGLNIGRPGCDVPICGREWITTLQPVVLEHWSTALQPPEHRALTTVGNWRGYGSIERNGVRYGQKVHSFRQFIELPMQTRVPFMPALSIHPEEKKDLAALASNHWHLVDPSRVAGTPAAYRNFVRGSWAEIGVAKSGYVASHCGWFSDRSACYLACGRPVIAQDTGWSDHLPSGCGLMAFTTTDGAVAAIHAVEHDYAAHCSAGRDVAEAYFDSDKVLGRLLRAVGVA
jgi:hypothetical protein